MIPKSSLVNNELIKEILYNKLHTISTFIKIVFLYVLYLV